MLFYRLQTDKGTGVYGAAYVGGGEHRPAPWSDAGWVGPCAVEGSVSNYRYGEYVGETPTRLPKLERRHRFGFVSMRHLRAWFDDADERADFARSGVRVYVWDVPEAMVTRSSRQAIVDYGLLNDANLVGVYPIDPSQDTYLG
jgi:hypothetical protein